ncbi:hypothetical protein DVG78_07335 [Runella aurantiaca]|uniref:Uncharacterized protein n=1 Tax=Runella aurantiaca TaxID=2282308 RepID=A0A369IIS3_9BACT|nr:hypothetical protein DVG78_07335 [Runella aurantiaca]
MERNEKMRQKKCQLNYIRSLGTFLNQNQFNFKKYRSNNELNILQQKKCLISKIWSFINQRPFLTS